MKVTEILMSEHTKIIENLVQLESIFNKGPIGEKINEILDHIKFIEEYADKFHHAKEEDIYFKWMLEKMPDLKYGPIMVMLKEHDEGRFYIKSAKENIEKFKENGNGDLLLEIKKYLSNFIFLLRSHISKENEILYQIAESINNQTQDGDQFMLPMFMEVNDNYTLNY